MIAERQYGPFGAGSWIASLNCVDPSLAAYYWARARGMPSLRRKAQRVSELK